MTQFLIHGERVTDSGLYPWALGSIGRALLFYAEARASIDNKIVGAITSYYSLFHLSMFLVFVCPHLLTNNQRNRINTELREGLKDPSPTIHHKFILKFLDDCEKKDFTSQFQKLLRKRIDYGHSLIMVHE